MEDKERTEDEKELEKMSNIKLVAEIAKQLKRIADVLEQTSDRNNPERVFQVHEK